MHKPVQKSAFTVFRTDPDIQGMNTKTEALWDADEVAYFLGVSRSTLYVYARRHDFPPAIRLTAKTVRWRPEQIRVWLKQYEDQPRRRRR